MAKLTELFAQPEFIAGPYETKKAMFDTWLNTDFAVLTQGVDETQKAAKADEAAAFFNQYNPKPENNFFSDALDVTQASFGTLSQLGSEFVKNTYAKTPASKLTDTVLSAAGLPTTVEALDQSSAAAGKFSQEQIGQLSPDAQEKRFQLDNELAAAETEGEKAKIIANFMVNNPSQIALSTLESFAPTVAGLLPAVRAAKAGGVVSGLIAGATAEGVLGGAEGALGARQEIYQALLQNGVREDIAAQIANDESSSAFLPSAALSAIVSPVGELLPAVKAFAKPASKVVGKTVKGKASDAVTDIVVGEPTSKAGKIAVTAATVPIAIAGEGLQGGLVQREQNRAVNEVTPTPLNKDALASATREAFAAGPTVGSFSALDATSTLLADPAEPTPDTDEILDAGDELVNQDPAAQDNGALFEDVNNEINQGTDNSPNSDTFNQGQENTEFIIRNAEQRRSLEAQRGNTNNASAIPNSEQPPGSSAPAVENTAGQTQGQGNTTGEFGNDNTAVGGTNQSFDGTENNPNAELGTGQTSTGSDSQTRIIEETDATPDQLRDVTNSAVWNQLNDTTDAKAEVSFNDLSPELKQRWRQAIQDNYASAALGDEIIAIHKNNLRGSNGGVSSLTPENLAVLDTLPENYTDVVRGKAPPTQENIDAAVKIKDAIGQPVVLDAATEVSQTTGINTNDVAEFSGALGAVNAAAKKTTKGAYLIADRAKGLVHLMTQAGKTVSSVPFVAQNFPQANTPVALGGKQIGAVSVVNVRGKGNKKVRGDLVDRGGITIPVELDKQIAGKNFSGNLYIVENGNTTTNESQINEETPVYGDTGSQNVFATQEPQNESQAQIRQFFNPVGQEVINAIWTRNKIDDSLMDILIAEAKRQDSTFFTEIFKKLKPWVVGVNLRVNKKPDPKNGGMYNWGSDTVTISNNDFGWNLHTIAHEMQHAATVHAIQGGSSKVNKIVDTIKLEFKHAQEVWVGEFPYAFKDIYEFVAEIFTNPDFRGELNKIAHNDKKTTWDHIKDNSFGIFNIQPMYTADGTIELTDLLFESSRQLSQLNIAPSGQRGATNWNDRIRGENSNDILEPLDSRRHRSHLAFRSMMEIRDAIVDNTARFLRELNLNTDITRGLNEYDEAPVYMALKSIPGIAQKIAMRFKNNQIREIENATRELHAATKDSGLSYREVRDLAAGYATLGHVKTATTVAFNKFKAEHKRIETELETIEAQLEPLTTEREQSGSAEPTPAEVDLLEQRNDLNLELIKIKHDIKEFVYAQANHGLGLNKNGEPTNRPTKLVAAVQGGATIADAEIGMKAIGAKIAGDINNLDYDASITAQLEKLRGLYVAAYGDVREFLHEHGEISDEAVIEWEESGLSKDFISYEGIDKEDSEVEPDTAFAATKLGDTTDFRRRGRTSAPDNAYLNLLKATDRASRKVASRRFRTLMLRHIQNGDFDRTGAAYTTSKQKTKFKKSAPPGIRPIKLLLDGKNYEFWLDNKAVMESIRGISEPRHGFLVQKFGFLTHAWAAQLTYLVPAFAPINAFKDVVEATTNISARNLKTADGKPINRIVLAKKIERHFRSWQLTVDTGNLYRARLFGKKPILEETANSYLGKKTIELENLGGLTTVFEQANQEFMRQANDPEISRFMSELMKKSVNSVDGLTPKQLKKALKEAGLQAHNTKVNLLHAIRLWNIMFEVRTKVAIYAALTEMGMSKEIASFRANDLLDLSQRGRWTGGLAALFPFFRAILAGSANMLRTLRTPRGWMMVTGSIATYLMLNMALRWAAGDNKDDPDLIYNCMDGLSPMQVRTSLPVFIRGENEKGCGRPIKAPVPYGLHYVANTAASMLLRNMGDNPLKTDETVLGEVAHAFLEETLPSKNSINATESASTLFKWATIQFTPPWATGIVNNVFNTNNFNRPIDRKVGAGANDGVFTTPEAYKKGARWLHDVTGGIVSMSPQKYKQFVESVTPGISEAIRLGIINEGGLKGKDSTFKEEIGFFNVIGFSKLIGEEPRPIERIYFTHTDEISRKLRKLGIIKVPRKSFTKKGLRGRGTSAFRSELSWTPKLIRENPELKEQADLAEKYSKRINKLNTRRNKIYKDIVIKGNKKRVMGMEPEILYIDEVNRLRDPKIKETLFSIQADKIKLEREFVKIMNEMERNNAGN